MSEFQAMTQQRAGEIVAKRIDDICERLQADPIDWPGVRAMAGAIHVTAAAMEEAGIKANARK